MASHGDTVVLASSVFIYFPNDKCRVSLNPGLGGEGLAYTVNSFNQNNKSVLVTFYFDSFLLGGWVTVLEGFASLLVLYNYNSNCQVQCG